MTPHQWIPEFACGFSAKAADDFARRTAIASDLLFFHQLFHVGALEMVAAAFPLEAVQLLVDPKTSAMKAAGGDIEDNFPFRPHFQKRHLIHLARR